MVTLGGIKRSTNGIKSRTVSASLNDIISISIGGSRIRWGGNDIGEEVLETRVMMLKTL